MVIAGARTLVCTLLVGTSFRITTPERPASETDMPANKVAAIATVPGPAARPTDLPEVNWNDFESEPLRRVHRVTAYCDRGVTAAGVWSGVGQCAAPADVPFGSLVYIPTLNRTFVVTDRTAERFRHNTVDIYIPDREACLQFGLNYLEMEIYVPSAPPRYASPLFESLIRTFASNAL